MKFSRTVVYTLITLACVSRARAGGELEKKLEELLPGMGAADMGGRKGPQQEWQEICFKAGAPGKERERAEVCRVMAAKLGPEVANPARIPRESKERTRPTQVDSAIPTFRARATLGIRPSSTKASMMARSTSSTCTGVRGAGPGVSWRGLFGTSPL